MKFNSLKLKAPLVNFICTLLVLLWVYAAGSKLADLEDFRRQLYNQTLGKSTANILFWAIPISELLAALLLLFQKTRFAGLVVSAFLMALFTVYIGLVLIGYYDRTPCSCGGVLKEMGWQMHFWFNLYFLTISGLGLWLERDAKSKNNM
ncbi:MAG: MauE/DoxX family redox-associated membrane protein [Bacteroidia bacterium]